MLDSSFWLRALALLSLVSPALSQGAGGGGSFSAKVRFANETPHHRLQWGTATVPFPKGVWTQGKTFDVDGEGSLEPFGARWPGGSVRFARLTTKLDIPANSEKLVTVREQNLPGSPFKLSPWVKSGLPHFGAQFVVITKKGMFSAPLKVLTSVEDSPERKTIHYRNRIPGTDLVYDFWTTTYTDQDSVPFELRLTNSSTGSKVWSQEIEAFGIVISGCIPVIRGSAHLDIPQTTPLWHGPNTALLLRKTNLYDGQAHEWWGDLLFADPSVPVTNIFSRIDSMLATHATPLYGVALNWDSSEAFGPFGYLPPFPAWITDGGRAANKVKRSRFKSTINSKGTSWADREKGLLKNPSSTGDQYDFGAAKMVDIFRTALPTGVEEARFHAGEEAFRPVHYREPNGTPLLAKNHRSWVPWSGRTHFNKVVSPDRLGKPYPEPYLGSQAHGWAGRDNQHWSSLTLASAYLLTTSFSLRMELQNEEELYKASHTLASMKPGWSTISMDAPRAVGRTYLSMSWNYLCTGSSELAYWMKQRVLQSVDKQYRGHKITGPVRPMHISGPDPRIILNSDFWTPWQEAQAVMGLEACHRVTGSTKARQLAELCAKNMITHGWRVDANSVIIAVGMAAMPGGAALTTAQLNDPNYAVWSYGTAFSEWSLPGVKLAHFYAVKNADKALETRSQNILNHLKSGRKAPRNGTGWDRYSDWDAVK